MGLTNKVIINNEVKIDLTSDTVSSDRMLTGTTAHDKTGAVISGNVVIQKYYTGTSAPTASFGSNGDLYLVTG